MCIRDRQVTHRYTMESLGFNYRLTDIQSALGLSQLKKLGEFTRKRNEAAQVYDDLFMDCEFLTPLKTVPGVQHARHLYVVKWDEEACGVSRDAAFVALRDRGIGVNVHYQPIYQQPFYQRKIQSGSIDLPCCPVAEQAYEKILSLPVFPSMTLQEVSFVVESLHKIATGAKLERRVA